MLTRFLYLTLTAAALATPVSAQTGSPPAPERTGAELYRAACASCHGVDGKGAPKVVVGFDTGLPDFTDCRFSSPEPDLDWTATIHLGGRARAFNRAMPAFGDALTDREIGRLIEHLRGFCTDPAWPHGDLNLPRPLVTEKAFPENEAVVTTTITAGHEHFVGNRFVYEHRIGTRGQYEVVVPFDLQRTQTGSWSRGLGDVAVAFKSALFHNLARGSIVTGGGEVTLPTGKEEAGLGAGLTVFEPFMSFGQVLPRDGFLHVHAGLEFPSDHLRANIESYWRAAVGKTLTQAGWGRTWSPMVELLGVRELGGGDNALWDLVPEMQVSLSTRQHILVNAGVRIPMNERAGRSKALLMYFLWDWFDGGLLSGW